MPDFVNEFAWFYKRRGARTDSPGVSWAAVLASVGAAHAWRLSGGNYADSVGGLDLSATGTVGSAAGPGGAGTAAEFNGTGSTSYLSASDAGFPSGSAARSVGGWFLLTSIDGAYHVPFSYGTSSSLMAHFILGLPTGEFTTDLYAAGSGSPTPAVAGTWYHVASTYGAGTLALYIDGSLVDFDSLTANTTPSVVSVGRSPNGDAGFRGAACDVVFAAVAWDAAAVTALYNGGSRLV